MKMLKAIREAYSKQLYCRPLGWRKKALAFGQYDSDRLYVTPQQYFGSPAVPANIPPLVECLGEWETLTSEQLIDEIDPKPPIPKTV